jgi:hypothetical protein
MAKQPKLAKPKLEPLKIKCTSTDCDNGLHCFKASRKTKSATEHGACRECGVKLVDWPRVHENNSTDALYTFAALKNELIRHHFWHIEVDLKAVNYARRKGVSGLKTAVRSRLRASVSRANNPYDGRQTPMDGSGNPIHYAQHATASCCRTCMEYWHGIPRTKDLTDDQIEYLAELIMLYVRERIPGLKENGEHVPPIRHARQ